MFKMILDIIVEGSWYVRVSGDSTSPNKILLYNKEEDFYYIYTTGINRIVFTSEMVHTVVFDSQGVLITLNGV